MTATTHTAGAIAASAFTLPALAFAIGPIFKRFPHTWQTVGQIQDYSQTNYVPVVINLVPGIGEVGNTTVYVRQHNTSLDTDVYDRTTPYIAITSRCAHLGCPVRWVPASERFICPCHGGVYDLLGRQVGGPPVRPLDRFPTRVLSAAGAIVPFPSGATTPTDYVQISSARFSVNSRLRRFSPRDPGEPVDGIGQYLYPSRPSDRISLN
jgi:Rieske Fe-S protein